MLAFPLRGSGKDLIVKRAALAVVVVVCALSQAAVAAQSLVRTLDVYWIDVEGGAATLIVTPAGESILVDTGYPDERGAPRIHKVATAVAGLKRIDHLIVTHFHSDHFGGALDLSRLMPVGRVHDNGEASPPPDAKTAPLVAAYAAAFVGRRRLLQPGDTIALQQEKSTARLALRLLGTREQFVPPPPASPPNAECASAVDKPADTSDNRNSAVLLLEFGPFRLFDGGDLTWNTEKRLACPVNPAGAVDVYQVTHHGLDQSNNPALVRALAPTVAVMNNGARKGTQPQTVATLKSTSSIRALYQVHKNVRDDGENSTADEYIANLEEHCAAHYIKMSVAPDGRRYTVSIPATGHSRTYETRAKS